MIVLLASLYVYHVLALSLQREKMALEPLSLELLMAVNHCVGAGTLCKSKSHLSSSEGPIWKQNKDCKSISVSWGLTVLGVGDLGAKTRPWVSEVLTCCFG